MKRTVQAELLDQDLGTPAEVERSLADLRRVNRLFGGISLGYHLVRRVAEASGAQQLSLLDVGSASGDVPAAVRRRLARDGVALDVTLMDRVNSHFNGGPRLPRVVGDALALPFRDSSFDVVSCALFTHHLEPEELVRFVNDALRVSRRAVLINDLRRSTLHLALIYAGYPLYTSRITRHDGPASVRRAYTVEEMTAILQRTTAARVEVSRHYLCRLGVVAWRS